MSVVINGDTGISGVNGSAATPAIQGGDADTGIFFGSDTAAIATGGVQRLTVDSSGRVGIGEVSPSSPLHVNQSIGNINLELHSSGSGRGTQIRTHNDHGEFFHGLAGDTTGDFLYYTPNDNSHVFGVSNDEKMRLNSDGLLLIGGSDSEYTGAKLQVGNDSGVVAYLYNKDISSNGIATLAFGPSNTIAGGQIKCNAEEDFSDSATRTANLSFEVRKDGSINEAMRINSDEKVFVGTTSSRGPALFQSNVASAGSHTFLYVNGNGTNTSRSYHAGGRHTFRGLSNINIDLLRSNQSGTNIGVVCKVEIMAVSAVTNTSAIINLTAGFFRVGGGNFTFYANTPQ